MIIVSAYMLFHTDEASFGFPLDGFHSFYLAFDSLLIDISEWQYPLLPLHLPIFHQQKVFHMEFPDAGSDSVNLVHGCNHLLIVIGNHFQHI